MKTKNNDIRAGALVILNGHFSHLPICWKNCKVCKKKMKINEKEAEDGPFLIKKLFTILVPSRAEKTFLINQLFLES